MKIGFVAASSLPSSAANSIQVMKTCQAFAQLGHDVHLYVTGNRGSKLPPIDWESLQSFYGLSTSFEIACLPIIPGMRHYDLAWKAIQQAQRMDVELVYTWMLQAAWLGLQNGLPAMLELHDRITGKIGPLLFRQILAHPKKKRLLPITLALQKVLEEQFGRRFQPGQAVISPDGVDLERYSGLPQPAAARQALGLVELPTAVYTGHLYAGRGLELLSALARVNPGIRFLWVGGKPGDVRTWTQRLHAAGVANVTLTGFVENSRLPLYQAAGDVLLMPYERKVTTSSGGDTADICSPMKMFEYMAAGRAILSSDLPVLHEVLNVMNAVFCPPDDFNAWNQVLNGLLGDAGRRMRLGSQAQRDVKQYTWQARAGRALEDF